MESAEFVKMSRGLSVLLVAGLFSTSFIYSHNHFSEQKKIEEKIKILNNCADDHHKKIYNCILIHNALNSFALLALPESIHLSLNAVYRKLFQRNHLLINKFFPFFARGPPFIVFS